MGEENKNSIWGLSLSLRPPIVNNYYNEKSICKREPHFSTDRQTTKKHKPNETSMIMPRTIEMDVKPPLAVNLEEVVEISKVGSPNSTLSSNANVETFGGFRRDRDLISDEEEDGGGSLGGGSSGEAERKKLRLSKEQIMVLEQAFREHTTLNTRQKMSLARQVNLKPRQVEVWFQNRRARTKLKQTEVDCEYLRRLCETLTEQNRRLLKEVQELRTVNGKNNHHGTTLNTCSPCNTASHSSSSFTTSTTTKAGCFLAGGLKHPSPLNLKQMSSTINNNSIFRSQLPRI